MQLSIWDLNRKEGLDVVLKFLADFERATVFLLLQRTNRTCVICRMENGKQYMPLHMRTIVGIPDLVTTPDVMIFKLLLIDFLLTKTRRLDFKVFIWRNLLVSSFINVSTKSLFSEANDKSSCASSAYKWKLQFYKRMMQSYKFKC